MNTRQKYVGMDSHANPTDPAATTDTHPAPLPAIPDPLTESPLVFEVPGEDVADYLHGRAFVLAYRQDESQFAYLAGGLYIIDIHNALVVKRIIDNELLTQGTLTLHSENPLLDQVTVKLADIKAVWAITEILRGKLK